MFRKLLALALSATPIAAHADWYEASTGHFVVYSEQKPETLEKFAANLERFDKAVRIRLSQPDDPVGKANRVTVYVVDDTGDVAKLAGDRGVAGFYRPRAGGSLAIVPRSAGSGEVGTLSAQAILLHEYAHHLMWSFWPHSVYPAWYVEGFAEFLGTAEFDKDGSVLFGTPPQYRGWGLLAGNALPIEKLLIADSLKLNDEQRDGLYGRGWLLTHYLIYGGESRKGQLGGYMQAINEGKSPKEAAAVFGDLRKLDKELERYKMGKFPRLRILAKGLPIGEIAMRKLTPGEAATMNARIRTKNGVTAKTAPGVFEAARKAAAPYPNDPGAQLVLAETAYDVRDYATAEAAADRALAADPRAIDGYVYKAMARMGVAVKAGDRSKETWSAIRKIIASGNKLDPDDPEPLILYYRSFVEAHQPPTQNAKLGLTTAFALAPQDPGLRLNTATLYLRDGRKADARALLAPLAYQPHSQGLALLAGALIEMIDSGKIAEAVKMLDAEPDKAEDDGKKEK